MGPIANNLEPRPFPNHKGSIYSPSIPGPILDMGRYNNLAHNNFGGDNTLGNRKTEALSIPVGVKRNQNTRNQDRDSSRARQTLIRLI
jgi:hypothetical protein